MKYNQMITQQPIDDCLEALCKKGCRAVWKDIAALEAGELLPEVQNLSLDELSMVIIQLKSIMSIYPKPTSFA